MTPPEIRHILVSRTDKVGDLLLSLPAFQALSQSYPQARITALVSPYARPIVEKHPSIDAVETYDPSHPLAEMIERFRVLSPDAIVFLFPRPKIAWAAFRAGIPFRIGTGRRWYSWLFNRRVAVHRRGGEKHEAEYNFEVLKPLGIQQVPGPIQFPLEQEEEEFAEHLLSEKGILGREPFVAVHPGHKGSALNWKPQRYAQVIEEICRVGKAKVVVTAGPDEGPLIERIRSFLPEFGKSSEPVYLVGSCTLRQLAAVYRRASCFLAGSTGTMHLAAAVGTPTVSLFCPIPDTTPVRWGPWGNESTILMPEGLTCPQCVVGHCKRHDPMDAISVDSVLQAIDRYLDKAMEG